MKLKHIFAAMAFVALTVSAAQAQQTHFGVKAGMVSESINLKAGNNDLGEIEARTGFQAGLALQAPLGYGFTLQPEALFAKKSAEIKGLGKSSYDVYAVEVPINLQWGYQFDEQMNIRPFVQAGPYFGYAVKKEVVTPLGTGTVGNDDENIQNFNAGVGLGLGLDVWKLQLMCTYKLGMTDVFKDNSPINGKWNGWVISLGILF